MNDAISARARAMAARHARRMPFRTARPAALHGRQLGQHACHVGLHQRQCLVGVGQQLVVHLAGQDVAAQVDQHRLDAGAVQPHAHTVRALGIDAVQAGGLPALALVTAAGPFDQPGFLQRLDDAARRCVGQLGPARQVGLGRLARTAQPLQQRALVVLAKVDRVGAAARTGGRQGCLLLDGRAAY